VTPLKSVPSSRLIATASPLVIPEQDATDMLVPLAAPVSVVDCCRPSPTVTLAEVAHVAAGRRTARLFAELSHVAAEANAVASSVVPSHRPPKLWKSRTVCAGGLTNCADAGNVASNSAPNMPAIRRIYLKPSRIVRGCEPDAEMKQNALFGADSAGQ